MVRIFPESNMNENTTLILSVIFVLYGALVQPTLPNKIQSMLVHPFVKLTIFTVILCISKVDLQLALLLTIIFMILLNLKNEKKKL